MKLTKGLYSLIIGGAILTAQAASAENAVEAQKVAAPTLLPNAYGVVDLRHYTMIDRQPEGDKQNPAVQARATLGSTFMNDKLDVYGIMAATAKPATEKIKQRRPEIDAKYTLIGGAYGEVSPEIQIATPHEGSATDGAPGLYAQLKAPSAELTFGKLDLSVSGEWTTHLASRPADADVDNESGKPLNEVGLVGKEGEPRGKIPDGKKDLDLNAEYIAAAGLTSGKAGIEVSQWLDQNYFPRYVVNTDGDVETSRPVQTTTTQRVKLSYKVTDKTTLSNETYIQQGGVFERQLEGTDENKGLPQFTNVVKASYTL